MSTTTEWADMTAFQRNWLIGEMMKAEPLRAYYLRRDGRNIGQLEVKDEGEAKSWLNIANMSLTNWVKLMPEVPYECRAEVAIHVETWHMRYSDTPGGGWEVVEWLRKRGQLEVMSCALGGWTVRLHVPSEYHGDPAETAPTVAEAACRVAMRVTT